MELHESKMPLNCTLGSSWYGKEAASFGALHLGMTLNSIILGIHMDIGHLISPYDCGTLCVTGKAWGIHPAPFPFSHNITLIQKVYMILPKEIWSYTYWVLISYRCVLPSHIPSSRSFSVVRLLRQLSHSSCFLASLAIWFTKDK